ncbi:helix-turn-helix domain-containing protein [bacterium]|nr:MAG: helix-turn-helix domain-containing protein [bacterium]
MSVGAVLAAKRGERGLTIQQAAAATRIRADHLSALEADEPERLAAPVYAKGYLRTYARYLGLDPEPLVGMLDVPAPDPRRNLRLGTADRPPRITATAAAAAVVGVVMLALAFSVYAARQIQPDQRAQNTPASPITAAGPAGTPVPAPSPQARPIVVGVQVTDAVWINVTVDGKAQYSDAGKVLPAGSVVYFTGVDVRITSGKAAATFITIDGRAAGALGTGVATREFSSQTSS